MSLLQFDDGETEPQLFAMIQTVPGHKNEIKNVENVFITRRRKEKKGEREIFVLYWHYACNTHKKHYICGSASQPEPIRRNCRCGTKF